MTSNTTSFTIPPWYFDELTVVNVARITIAVIAIVGHSFIIHLFVRFRQLRKTQYNHLVLMLVFSDLLLGTSPDARFSTMSNSDFSHIFTPKGVVFRQKLHFCDFSLQYTIRLTWIKEAFFASKMSNSGMILRMFLPLEGSFPEKFFEKISTWATLLLY